jgi:hypothetical protein
LTNSWIERARKRKGWTFSGACRCLVSIWMCVCNVFMSLSPPPHPRPSCASHKTLSRLPSMFDTVTLYNHLHFVLTMLMDVISKQFHVPLSLFSHNFPGSYGTRNHMSCYHTSILWLPSHLWLTLNRLNIFETGINSWRVSLQEACMLLHCWFSLHAVVFIIMHVLLFNELLLLLVPLL